jgi:zinc transport system ATP-binding protein
VIERVSTSLTPSTPAVEFENVSFAYPGAAGPALENISLRVSAGERLGILGPNGGGKSTLIKLLLGLIDPSSGRVRIQGMSPKDARRQGLIGYVPQRPDIELAMPLSVRETVTLGAAWRTPPWMPVPRAARDRVSRMLALVGAEAFADKPIGALSGGQLQRAMIARSLAASATILALDEPTVGIDASGQQRFAELLKSIHADLGVTMLVVSHDLRAIVAGSDRVACLARRLHSHTSPQGLTPQVLAELFSHDVAGLGGVLAGMHVHAHGAGEPCDHSHGHTHAPPADAAPVSLSVSAKQGGPRAHG